MSYHKEGYPTRESLDKDGVMGMWPLFGYNSEMVNMALARGDAEAFVGFMAECGLGPDAITFDGLTMEQYCDKRNSPNCKAAIKALGK